MKAILSPQAITQLPMAQRLAIGRQVMAQASATHTSWASGRRAPNPFVDPQAFLVARRNAAQGIGVSKSLEANHVE